MARIKFTVDVMGNPKIEALDTTGDECVELTKGLEQALGGVQTKGRVLKAEYYSEEGSEEEGNKMTW